MVVLRASAYPTSEEVPEEEEETNSDILLLHGKQSKHNKIELVTPRQLQQLLVDENVRLVDVRNAWELVQVGKIGPSINIPLSDVESAFKLNGTEFKSTYGIEKPALDDCNLVFHCKSGRRSLKAAEIVQNLGYKCPKSLDGGFTAWKEFLLQ